MPFIDAGEDIRHLESVSGEALEALTVATDRARTRLMNVAILADMAKQGRTLAVVTRPYIYYHEIKGIEISVTVPEGFVTDFASIPGPAQILIQPFGRHAPAAVLHDFLYALGQKKARAYADRLFLHAMQESGVSFFRRSLMFRMVRLFGGRGYGLEQDWAFVETEYGRPAEPPFPRDSILWAPRRRKKKDAAVAE